MEGEEEDEDEVAVLLLVLVAARRGRPAAVCFKKSDCGAVVEDTEFMVAASGRWW